MKNQRWTSVGHKVFMVGLFLFGLSLPMLFPRHASAQEICFPDVPGISWCIAEPFASYWRSNGGLAVFGYPITAAQEEWSNEVHTSLRTQWTERNRLEHHPENPAPYHILLGRMGADRLAQLGRDPLAEGREAGPKPGCLWFEHTGHNVCNQDGAAGFRTYWESHGLLDPMLDPYQRSLALFGYPLTEAAMETNPDDGKVYLTQWFERARFEWHPDNPPAYRVLLGLLGNELRRASSSPSPSPSPPKSASPLSPDFRFGAEITQGAVGSTAALAAEAGLTWIRYNGIRWDEVEATPGHYDWTKLKRVEQELQDLASYGLTPVVIIRGTPSWAQSVAGSRCSAVKREHLDAFAAFVGAVVQRYHGAPYHVHFWELGNEPDVDPSLISDTLPFGCWGDKHDPYYGGRYYGEMLKRVAPVIRAADPSAQIVIGGLLLDCDPGNPPPNKDCTPGKFFEGILKQGAADAFDIVAYHGYAFWSSEAVDWDLAHPSWRHRGGAMPGRLDFLRSLMAQYRVEKPIFVNEIGLLCYENNPYCVPLGYLDASANYAIRTYVRAWAKGIAGAFWYTLNYSGWHDAGLLDTKREPRPAYHTIKFLTNLLNGASYEGKPAETPAQSDIEGYGFRRGQTRYLVFWSNNQQHQATLPTPAGTQRLYTMHGDALEPTGEQIRVSFEPIIIEQVVH